MAITAALVKQLRETSGAGMMDCKKALEETNGDIDAAIDWLRTKGLATAAKKSGRVASEGLIAIHVAGNSAAMIELNAETDFVSRNDDFQSLALNLAKLANDAADIASLNDLAFLEGKIIEGCDVSGIIRKLCQIQSKRLKIIISGHKILSLIHISEPTRPY